MINENKFKTDKHQKLLDYLNSNDQSLKIFIKINNPITEAIGFQDTLNKNKEVYQLTNNTDFEIQQSEYTAHSVYFQRDEDNERIKSIYEFMVEGVQVQHPKYGKSEVVSADFINEMVLIKFPNFEEIQLSKDVWSQSCNGYTIVK